MLCIRQHIAKQLPGILLIATARRVLEKLHAGGEGFRACGRECAPRVELAIRPVRVRGSNGPAAEDGVGARGVGPVWEKGAGSGGELAVTNIVLMYEGVVFADELVGPEVRGLEVSCSRFVKYVTLSL